MSDSDSDSPRRPVSKKAASTSSSEVLPRIKGIYQVLPYLFVGGADAATNKEELKYLGIKHILNCSSEDVDNFFPDDFKYHNFHIEDVHDAEPSQHFQEAYDIMSAIKDGKSVIYVHCTTGKNVAPTIVLAYMMMSAKNQNKHLPLLQAYNFLSGKAPGIQPSDQFMQQLIELEEELFEEASIKLKGTSSRPKIGAEGSRVGVGRGGRGGRGGKGKRGK